MPKMNHYYVSTMDVIGDPLMPHSRLLYVFLLMQVCLLHAPMGGQAVAAQHIMPPDMRICTARARQPTDALEDSPLSIFLDATALQLNSQCRAERPIIHSTCKIYCMAQGALGSRRR